MAIFYQNRNNGVVAVVRFDHALLAGIAAACDGDYLKLGVKVFTFVDAERLTRQPGIYTGSLEFLAALIKQGGHELRPADQQSAATWRWKGFVPFSNGMETGMHGQEAQKQELRYKTTAEDVEDIFHKEE